VAQRHTLDDRRVGLEKIEIALDGGLAVLGDDTPLSGDEIVLQKDPEEAFKFWNAFGELIVCLAVEQQELGIFQRFDVVIRRLAREETIHVRDPPTLDSKLQNVLITPLVDGVGTETSLLHEGGVLAHLPFLDKETPLTEFSGHEERRAASKLLIVECNVLGNMLTENVVHAFSTYERKSWGTSPRLWRVNVTPAHLPAHQKEGFRRTGIVSSAANLTRLSVDVHS
jgi:hypothetical protein